MLIDICLGTRTAWKILLLMSETPGKGLTRKQIMEQTKIGNKVLIKSMLLLQKSDIISGIKQGRQFIYKMNMANPMTNAIIGVIFTERQQLNAPYFSTAIVIREFVYELTNINLENMQKIFLFGSVAKHTANINSDIDIAIISKEKSLKDELQITGICGKIKERFKREIQPHYFTEEEFKKKNKLAEEIMKDGIRLL
ncbi:MAG: nucleotidyltransferase domain-containing protein [Nanoarchaeota archaeon]|nr:nucleotidyltransferase domain-containing protein [Nanoarchaeota archaeon]